MAWLLKAVEALIEFVPIKSLLSTTTHDPKIGFKDVRAAPTQLMGFSSMVGKDFSKMAQTSRAYTSR
jgi:hypothetical protein